MNKRNRLLSFAYAMVFSMLTFVMGMLPGTASAQTTASLNSNYTGTIGGANQAATLNFACPSAGFTFKTASFTPTIANVTSGTASITKDAKIYYKANFQAGIRYEVIVTSPAASGTTLDISVGLFNDNSNLIVGSNFVDVNGVRTAAVTYVPTTTANVNILIANGITNNGFSQIGADMTIDVREYELQGFNFTPSNAALCTGTGASIQIGANFTAAGTFTPTYVWTANVGNGATEGTIVPAFSTPTTTKFLNLTNFTGVGTNTYTVSVAYNTCTYSKDYFLTVNGTPTLAPTSTTTAYQCFGNSVSLTGGITATLYNNAKLSTLSPAFVSGTLVNTPTFSGFAHNGAVGTPTYSSLVSPTSVLMPFTANPTNPLATYVQYQYTVSVTDLNNCVGTTTLFVYANPRPSMNEYLTATGTIVPAIEGCYGEQADIRFNDASHFNFGGPTFNYAAYFDVLEFDPTSTSVGYVVGGGTVTPTYAFANAATASTSAVVDFDIIGQPFTATFVTGNNSPIITFHPRVTVTLNSDAACTYVRLSTFSVNPLPVPTIVGPAQICQGNTATLTVNNLNTRLATTTWTWNSVDGTVTPTNAASVVVSPTNVGSNPYTVTISNSKGCTASTGTDVFSAPAPIAQLVPATTTLCKGVSVRLDAYSNVINGNYTFKFYANGGLIGTTVGTTTASLAYVPATAGTVSLTLEVIGNGNGCTDMSSSVITVLDAPTVNVTAPALICNGSTAQVSTTPVDANTTYTLYWIDDNINPIETQVGNGTFNVLPNNPSPTAITAATFIITGNNGACALSDTAYTNIKPGITLSLAVTDPSSGYLNLGTIAGTSPTYTRTLPTAAEGTTSYTFRYCENSTVRFTVKTGTASVLAGAQISVSSNDGNNFQTIGQQGDSAIIITPGFSPTVYTANLTTPVVAETYNVTYNVNVKLGDCIYTQVATLPIGRAPEAFVAADQLVCAGTTISLGKDPQVPNTGYSWTPATSVSSANSNNPTATPNSTQDYALTQFHSTTGCSRTNTAKISVPNTAAVVNTNLIPVDAVCAGTEVSLVSTTNDANVIYTWKNQAGTVVGTGFSITVTPQVNTTYFLNVTSGSCPATVSSPAVVKVINVTAAPSINANNSTVCLGDAVTLTAGAGYSSYVWFANGVEVPNQNTATLISTPVGTTTYTVKGQTGGCASAISTGAVVTTKTSEGAAPAISADASSVCTGGTVKLTATGAATTYQWFANGVLIPNANTAVINVNPLSSTTYTAVGKLNSCSTPLSNAVAVAVTSLPTNIVLNFSNASFCDGSSVNATINLPAGVTATLYRNGVSQGAFTGGTRSVNEGGSYYAEISQGNCKAITNTVNVVKNPRPAAVAIDVTISGDNATFCVAAGFYKYVWTNVNSTTNCADAKIVDVSNKAVTVKVTDVNGCESDASSKTIVSSINDVKENLFTVFPNPASDNLNIVLNANVTERTVATLYDVQGQEVVNVELSANKNTIDVSSLAKGVYNLRVVTGSTIAVKKVVLQ